MQSVSSMRVIERAVLLVVCLLPTCALANHQLIWLTDNDAEIPHYHTDSPYTLSVDTTRLVLQSLQQYNLEFVSASIDRINTQLRTTPNTCVSNRLSTPRRQRENLFSLPFNFHPMPMLFYRNDNVQIPLHVLDPSGSVTDVSGLFEANPQARLLMVEGMNYGAQLEPDLSSLPEEQKSYISADSRYETAARLFSRGLVDMVIEYPSRFLAALAKLNHAQTIHSLTFSHTKQFQKSYIACSRSALGKQVIADINATLRGLYRTPTHKNAHLRHLPLDSHPAFLNEYTRVYGDQDPVVLKVAVDHFPPWMVNEPGHAPYGIDIDFLDRIAAETGIEMRYMDCPFGRCLRMLETGELDYYPSLFRDAQREQYISFVETPVNDRTYQAFYLRATSPIEIGDYEDLTGLSIGVLRGGGFFDKFDRDDSLVKVPIVDNDTVVDMLLKGRIDTFIGNEAVVDYIIRQRKLNALIRKAAFGSSYDRQSFIGLSTRSAHLNLKPEIEKAVKRLRAQNVMEAIYAEWVECCGLSSRH